MSIIRPRRARSVRARTTRVGCSRCRSTSPRSFEDPFRPLLLPSARCGSPPNRCSWGLEDHEPSMRTRSNRTRTRIRPGLSRFDPPLRKGRDPGLGSLGKGERDRRSRNVARLAMAKRALLLALATAKGTNGGLERVKTNPGRLERHLEKDRANARVVAKGTSLSWEKGEGVAMDGTLLHRRMSSEAEERWMEWKSNQTDPSVPFQRKPSMWSAFPHALRNSSQPRFGQSIQAKGWDQELEASADDGCGFCCSRNLSPTYDPVVDASERRSDDASGSSSVVVLHTLGNSAQLFIAVVCCFLYLLAT
eukprot:scaffold285_cov330-Pavlova_lutheri.AAC.120